MNFATKYKEASDGQNSARFGDMLTEKIYCEKCRRLADYRSSIKSKRNPLLEHYHNNPVPPFGDPDAWLLIIGLAPGAHGANRTGRVFTGDGAGVLLYQALYASGFSNKAESVNIGDELILTGVCITNALWCVPPGNKPTSDELRNCLPKVQGLLEQMPTLTDILCIGAEAYKQVCRILLERPLKFAHGLRHKTSKYMISCSFHTSSYNQSTKRITITQVIEVLELIKSGRDLQV